MNIPDKIIESIELLPISDRSQVYCAVITYMRSGAVHEEELSQTALGFFLMVKEVLDPILHRRRVDAARRKRKKEAAAQKTRQASIVEKNQENSSVDKCEIKSENNAPIPQTDAPAIYVSRRQRREIEREQKRASRKRNRVISRATTALPV